MNKLKDDYKFILVGISLIIICILLIITMHTDDDFTLFLPSASLTSLASWIIVIVLGSIGIIFLKDIEKKNIDLAKVFLILIIPISILTSMFRPLGRIPDEVAHARKSMAIAQGSLFSQANPEKEGRVTDSFNSKLNELVSNDSKTYEEALRRLKLPETEDQVELEYTNMALYSPICHLPQAFGMFIARLLKLPVAVQCYAGRLANFSLSVFLIYMAIKLIPTKKIVVVLLSLLPITIQEIVSLSADAISISMSIFYISYLLYLKYDKNKLEINSKDLWILLTSSIVISLSKIVYLPLCFLLILLPKEKFKTNKKRIIAISTIILIAILLNAIWLMYSSRFLIEFNAGVDSKEQLKFILTKPIQYFLILFRSINDRMQLDIVGLVGEALGVYDSQSSVLFIYPCIIIATMLFLVNDKDDNIEFDTFTKLVCLAVFIIIIVLINTSLYIQWTSVEHPIIQGVQSRYYIPILLLATIFLNNKCLLYNNKLSKRYILLFMLFLNLNTISVILFRYHIGA